MKTFDPYNITLNDIAPENTITWVKPTMLTDKRAMTPFNPATKHNYQGLNQMDLYLPQLQELRGDEDHIPDLRYLTEKQIAKYNGEVDPRSALTITFANGSIVKRYDVYNMSLVHWYDNEPFTEYKLEKGVKPDFIKPDVRVITGLILPSYVPHENRVYVPKSEYCVTYARYMETIIHEIIHWTRNNIDACHRCLPYPMEELVACIGSAMLMHEVGIETSEGQEKMMLDYIRSWVRALIDKDSKQAAIEEATEYANIAVENLI